MPIHGPRKALRKKKSDADDIRTFDTMLDDWLMNRNPHGLDLHFPDYSCCHAELKAGVKDKRDFIKAMARADVPVIERLRQQFEGAYWAYKEKHAKTNGESGGDVKDNQGVDADTRSAYLH